MRFMGIVGRLAFAAFLISLLVGLAAVFGMHLHVWGYQFGLYGIFPYCLYAGAAGLALGALWGVAALILNAETASTFGVIGLIGSLIIIAPPLYTLYMVKIAHAIPPIHDISTDTEHAPPFVALLRDRTGATNPAGYDGPKLVKTDDGRFHTTSSLQKKFYSDIRPIGELAKPALLYRRALVAARAMGWNIVAAESTQDGGRIEATDTSFFFGLTDDIVIRVKASGIGARLDIRSKSRVGTTDLGANAAHISAYVKKLTNTN